MTWFHNSDHGPQFEKHQLRQPRSRILGKHWPVGEHESCPWIYMGKFGRGWVSEEVSGPGGRCFVLESGVWPWAVMRVDALTHFHLPFCSLSVIQDPPAASWVPPLRPTMAMSFLSTSPHLLLLPLPHTPVCTKDCEEGRGMFYLSLHPKHLQSASAQGLSAPGCITGWWIYKWWLLH